MRTIKFRALVEPENKKDLPYWIYYSTLEIPYKPKNVKRIIVKDLQFTGLKDKNGKEIYGGDIIEHQIPVLGTDRKPVIFEKGCFKLKDYDFNEWVYPGATFEVIGNIYENPELLKR